MSARNGFYSILLSYYPLYILILFLALVDIARVYYDRRVSSQPSLDKPFLILVHPYPKELYQVIEHPSGVRIYITKDLTREDLMSGDCMQLSTPNSKRTQFGIYDPKFKIIPDCSNSLLRNLSKFRQIIIDRYKSKVKTPYSDITLGITLGYKAEFSPEFTKEVQVAGLSHIFVVSGSNFSLLNYVLRRLFSKMGKYTYFSSVIFFSGIYLILCGVNPPAMRAVVMSMLLSISAAKGEKSIGLYQLVVSYLFIIFLFPNLYNSLSFNLSCAATLGMVISGYIPRITTSPYVNQFVGNLVINIFIFPIIIFYFGEYSILSIISYIFIADLMPFYTICGFFSIILCDYMTVFITLALGNFILTITTISGTLYSLVPIYIKISSFPLFAVLIYYFASFLLILLLFRYKLRCRVY